MMKPIVLIIMDGWGIRKEVKGNAPRLAKTPNIDSYMKKYPHRAIEASGTHVGLPKDNQGSSEVGHLNLGAGRKVKQNLVRINNAVKDRSFSKNKVLVDAIKACRKNHKTLHLMGLLQDQGVHAHQDHLFELLRMAKCHDKVAVHVFADGRDTKPRSCMRFIKKLKQVMKKTTGFIATVSGRYYAMDRDNRWARVKKAYLAIAEGKGRKARTVEECIKNEYSETDDEFVTPTVIGDYKGVERGDIIIFYNFRFDRARQLTKAFVERRFNGFKRKRKGIRFVCMTEYYTGVPAKIAFRPLNLGNNLGRVLSRNKLKQLRISETEKYAHVTFFFNGLVEKPNRYEDRILVQSPKIATYDLKPEMSVYEITDRLMRKVGRYDVVISNFVNGDMVGHTGVLKAGIKACQAVDECVGKIVGKVLSMDGAVIVVADHGNCEYMIGKNGSSDTAHTTSKVPFIVISNKKFRLTKVEDAALKDVAPSLLFLLGIKQPKDMKGKSLIR